MRGAGYIGDEIIWHHQHAWELTRTQLSSGISHVLAGISAVFFTRFIPRLNQ
jgi:hypothetical protein